MQPCRLWLLISFAALAAGCSVFPGLRVITGEDAASVQPDQTVASLDLVMGDKSGNTDPMLINIADRIEAANPFVDIIEIRRDSEARVFSLNMLFVPPQTANTLQGQREQLDLMRRSIELGWRAILATSEGTDILRITLLGPGQLDTIDHGPSFVGVIRVVFEIDRSDAVTYLQGQRSLESFNNMVADGTIRYRQPQELELYTGSPNHPMSLSPAAGTP